VRSPDLGAVYDELVARKLGASGIVLFSYDSLTGPTPPAPDYLATVSKGAFAINAATLPAPK